MAFRGFELHIGYGSIAEYHKQGCADAFGGESGHQGVIHDGSLNCSSPGDFSMKERSLHQLHG
jgi:hypothetical protein